MAFVSTKPVTWGILSTAKIGREKVIPAMKRGKLCRIRAIASRDEAGARQVADELGIPKAYGSYEELLGDASAQAETFDMVDQYTIQGELFSDAIRSGKPVEFPLEDAVKNMRVIDALFRSAENGRWEKV